MNKIVVGDCVTSLAAMDAGSVQTCVTSPPYWNLRDYGVEGQHGLEVTPAEYVAQMVNVFREVRRVLRDDGTLWLNLGDSYDNKNLVGAPWRVALGLQADGWHLRSDIIWHKTNPMPSSVADRPTRAHEYVFLMSKSPRYFYDHKAISEPAVHAGETISLGDKSFSKGQAAGRGIKPSGSALKDTYIVPARRNRRTVWTIPTRAFSRAHFATMPPDLAEICIKAGSAPGDLVLDPYAGAGTTGLVALRLGRRFLGCELNPEYAAMAEDRIRLDMPLIRWGQR